MSLAERRTIRLGGFSLVIEAPADPDRRVREAESRGDPEPGYWAHLWPASIALAEHVAASSIIGPGMRVLEIGCGLGLAGLAAAARGSDVVLTDVSDEAVAAARHQAALNGLTVECRRFDWRDPPDASWRPDVLLGADVLYRKTALAPIASLIRTLGCPALLTVPPRPGAELAAEPLRRDGLSVWETPLAGARLLLVQRPDSAAN